MKKEHPKAIWKRRGFAMFPMNEEADAMMRSIKDGAECVGEMHGVRSIQQLRLYWGGLMKLLVNQNVFPNKDAASDTTKIASGHTNISVMPDTGEVHLVPKSIAFGSLSSAEFNVIFETMVDVVLDRWFGGDEFGEARDMVYEMLEDPALAALGKKIKR